MFCLLQLVWAQTEPPSFSSSLQKKLETSLSHDFVGVVYVLQGQKSLYTYSKGETLDGGVLGADSFVSPGLIS